MHAIERISARTALIRSNFEEWSSQSKLPIVELIVYVEMTSCVLRLLSFRRMLQSNGRFEKSALLKNSIVFWPMKVSFLQL